MLSDDNIEKLWVAINKGKFMFAGFNTFARAIEAAVLPEGWVAVPKEPTLAMLDCLRSDITSNLEKRYQAMLAAAPKAQAEKQEPFPFSADRVTYHKTAASPLDLMECLQDRPVEPSKAVQGKCVGQAEKQEPVKDEPVAWCVAYDDPRMGRIHSNPSMYKPELEALISRAGNPLALVPLYTRPQPDLTAEVERLKLSAEHWNRLYREKCQEFHDAQANKGQEIVWLIDRIAELEEAARQARDALQYHTSQTRPIFNTTEAIAKLDAVLGNAD